MFAILADLHAAIALTRITGLQDVCRHAYRAGKPTIQGSLPSPETYRLATGILAGARRFAGRTLSARTARSLAQAICMPLTRHGAKDFALAPGKHTQHGRDPDMVAPWHRPEFFSQNIATGRIFLTSPAIQISGNSVSPSIDCMQLPVQNLSIGQFDTLFSALVFHFLSALS